MGNSLDSDKLRALLRSLKSEYMDAGEVLYRGSFEGRPNEDWLEPRIRGVKTLTHDKNYALTYARREKNPLYISPPKDAKGVLFGLTLIESCKILCFPDDGVVFQDYVRHPLNHAEDFLSFERNRLMPIMKSVCGDDISGYISPNKTEVLLDLDSIRFELTAEIVPD